MEKKVNGKVLTANEAKPIIQKNVPGFQDKCSKESINSYNRVGGLQSYSRLTYTLIR